MNGEWCVFRAFCSATHLLQQQMWAHAWQRGFSHLLITCVLRLGVRDFCWHAQCTVCSYFPTVNIQLMASLLLSNLVQSIHICSAFTSEKINAIQGYWQAFYGALNMYEHSMWSCPDCDRKTPGSFCFEGPSLQVKEHWGMEAWLHPWIPLKHVAGGKWQIQLLSLGSCCPSAKHLNQSWSIRSSGSLWKTVAELDYG